jgi:hypothetical protein
MDLRARPSGQVRIGVEIQRDALARDELGYVRGLRNVALVINDTQGDRADLLKDGRRRSRVASKLRQRRKPVERLLVGFSQSIGLNYSFAATHLEASEGLSASVVA